MKHYIRLAAFVTVLAVMLSQLGIIGLAKDSSEARGFFQDFENATGTGDFIGSLGGSVKINEDANGNRFMTVCPVVDGITAFIQRDISTGDKVNLEIGFKYMQSGKKMDGACVFSLQSSNKDIIRLETQDGNIVMKKKASSNTFAVVENYSANRWYDFRFIVDFVNGVASVSVDNGTRIEEAEFLTGATEADLLYMGTPYSPGFCVDDIYAQPLQNVADISISGDTAPVVREGDGMEYTYTASVYDEDGVVVSGITRFYLSPSDDAGAVMTADGNSAKILFSEAAAGKTFTLTASAGEMSDSITIAVSKYAPAVSNMEIKGESKISSRTVQLYRYKYEVVFYDQYGMAMDGETASFKLVNGSTNVPSTVQVNEKTGEITVTGEVPKDTYIYLVATSDSMPEKSAQKRIVMLDAETYAADASRFEALLDYVDLVREIGRGPNGTPLLADVYDRYTKQLGEWRSGTDAGHAVTSNLAFKGGWYRMLDGLYALTGDQQYKDEVLDTYQYYLDHGLDEVSGTPIWGGHAAINLETGEPYFIYNTKYMELKEAGVYTDPFFEISPSAGSTLTRNMVDMLVTNWDWLRFNRHGVYQSEVHPDDEVGGWEDWETWSTDILDEVAGVGMPLETQEISFRSAGVDLAYMLSTMAKDADNEEDRQAAAQWAVNILQTYYRVENPDTYLGGYQASTFGIDNYDAFMEAYPEWWLPDKYDTYTYSISVDRFYRQFADDLVDQGFLTEENKWQAQECFVTHGIVGDNTTLLEMYTAENIGVDTEIGQYIMERVVKKLGNYIDLAYYPETNEFSSRLLWDGTSLEGFLSKRAGYFGGKDAYMQYIGRISPSTNTPMVYAYAYLASAGREDLEPYRQTIYSFIRNYYIANGAGDIGERYPGDNISLNLGTDMADGFHCITFLYLYQATGITDYLDMARNIANNFIDSRMVDGLFFITPSNVYIPLGGHKAERFHHALLMLEATIRGEEDKIPAFVPYGGYFEDKSYDEIEKGRYTSSLSDIKDTTYWFAYYNENVKAQEILLSEDEITVSPGETRALEISVLPKDASYSLWYDITDPSCVSINYDTNSIVGIRPGQCEIVITNTDKTAKAVLKVYVEED